MLQVQLLQAAVVQYDTRAAELHAANEDLAEELRQVREYALTLETPRLPVDSKAGVTGQLEEAVAGQVAIFQGQRSAQARELYGLRTKLSELEGAMAEHEASAAAQREAAVSEGVAALTAERDAAIMQRDAAIAESDAAMAEKQAAIAAEQAAVAEGEAATAEKERLAADLQAVKPLTVSLTVGYEAEWKVQCLRNAALESRCLQLQVVVAAFERQQRLELAR